MKTLTLINDTTDDIKSESQYFPDTTRNFSVAHTVALSEKPFKWSLRYDMATLGYISSHSSEGENNLEFCNSPLFSSNNISDKLVDRSTVVLQFKRPFHVCKEHEGVVLGELRSSVRRLLNSMETIFSRYSKRIEPTKFKERLADQCVDITKKIASSGLFNIVHTIIDANVVKCTSTDNLKDEVALKAYNLTSSTPFEWTLSFEYYSSTNKKRYE